MELIPEETEQELISSLSIGLTVSYIDYDEDYGLLDRIDREIRQGLKKNGKCQVKSALTLAAVNRLR